MISIIIPTYNRQSIFACLESIFASNLAAPNLCSILEHNFEVIVVAREPKQYLLDNIAILYPSVKIIEFNSPGNGPAKNHAAMFAKGEFVVFTDDDCVVDCDWLKRLVLTQQVSNADIVVGQCLPYDFTNPYLVAHQGLIMYYLDRNPYSINDIHRQNPDPNYSAGFGIFGKVEVGTSMNMLIRKSTFECLGGFSKEFTNHYGDDYDFNMRWKMDDSISAAYCKGAIVRHNHPLTFTKLIKLSFRYGMGLELCRKLALSRNKHIEELSKDIGSPNNIFSKYSINVHPSYSEYSYIKHFINWQSTLLDGSSSFVRWYASWLAMMALLVKRLGSWYGRKNPEVGSKTYDGV